MTPARWVSVGALAALTAIALYIGVAVVLHHAVDNEPPDLRIVHTDERLP